MDHDIWNQHEVSHHFLCLSSRNPKLKLQPLKKVQGNSTPVSKLCITMANSTLATPVKGAQQTKEPLLVETPVKPLQNPTAITPSISHIGSPVTTPLFTPECTSLNDTRAKISLSPLETPKITKIHSPVGTPLCVALEKPFKTKNVSSTPRRSSRKSIKAVKSHVSEISSKTENELNYLEDSSTELKLSDKNCKLHEVVIDPVNKICNEDKIIDNMKFSESLFARSAGSAIVPNPLDWLPDSLHHAVVHRDGITSEPRLARKSDIVGGATRRLSFSNKKSKKQKIVIPEYDPDDDIFAQGLMPVQFNNIDSLKNQIGQLLNCADIPSPQLRKSYSCGMLNNVHETQAVTPVSSKRKQLKRTPSSAPKAAIKRTLSAPELQKPVSPIKSVLPPPPPPLPPSSTNTNASKAPSSSSKVSSEGKIRALLRARDIIKNIRQRAKNFPIMTSEVEKQPLDTESDKKKSEEITSPLAFENRESSSPSGSLKEATDTYELLPPTQPFESFILGDVTAYVEVISKNEDISAGVRKELMKLGATVVPAFNRDVPVTHVVFNDGNISTYKKAKKRNIPLVSVLWIEACRKAGVKVHESLFPPHQIERYESPAIQKELKKRKIMRFYSDETQRPSPRQRKGVVQKETPIQPSAETCIENSAVRKSACAPKWVEEIAGGNGRVRMLVKMTGISKKEFKELVNRPPTPDSDIDLDQNSPLPVRLLRKLAKNLPVRNNLDSDETSTNIEMSDIKASSSKRASCENSFTKKLTEIGEMEDRMEISNKQKEEVARNPSVSAVNMISQTEKTNVLDVTLRRKVSKRKLLSPVQESLIVDNVGDVNDNANTVVENPHSCTPKKLNGEKIEKKIKTDNAEIEWLDRPEINKIDEDEAVGSREKECVTNAVDPVRRSRRSSSYFVKTKRCSPSPILQRPAIVCTQLHTPDIDLVASVVEKLGMFVVEKNVTSYTTHVVAGASKRTMKLLKGMVRGCWIVSHEWVLRSLEAGKWLDEEEFELTTFSSSVQKYRLEKLSFGGIFKPDIFSSCGPIFVSSQATVPRGDLVELILLCGGETVSRINKAKIAVGKKYNDIICVTALWILDSVQYYCCKPFDNYHCT
ncbi:Putative transcriptional regulator brca1 [Gryllus bimaculatus]|nr:Putative transcriptional regulator brca1 [Gryllus bimaculatus]